LPGQKWELEIEKAIRKSKLFIACLSDHSVSKHGYVQSEFKKAMKVLDMVPEDQVFIIPVRLNECEIPIQFSDIQYLDYFTEEGPSKLIETINRYIEIEIHPLFNDIVKKIDKHQIELIIKIAQGTRLREKVIDFLITELNNRIDPQEHYWIYIALGYIKGERAKAAIVKGLVEKNDLARLGAENALGLL